MIIVHCILALYRQNNKLIIKTNDSSYNVHWKEPTVEVQNLLLIFGSCGEVNNSNNK